METFVNLFFFLPPAFEKQTNSSLQNKFANVRIVGYVLFEENNAFNLFVYLSNYLFFFCLFIFSFS